MARNTPKNASGKWLNMSDEQLERENAAFQRAVDRQRAKDAAAVRTSRPAKVGDRVQIKREDSRHYHERGRVLAVAPTSGTLSVKLDSLAITLAFGQSEVRLLVGPTTR